MKKRIMGIISIIIFFIILLLTKFNNTLSIDNIIHNMVYNLKTNTLTNIMKIITFFASVKFTVIVSIIILQQIDANIINPKIIGDSLEISPILVILSVTIGGGYFGVIGMFLGVPVAAILKILVNDYIDNKLNV